MRPEDPPNKEVHANDLAQALSNLKTKTEGDGTSSFFTPAHPPASASPDDAALEPSTPVSAGKQGQRRSRGSTLIYHPEHHGTRQDLPSVMVEDTSLAAAAFGWDLSDMDISPVDMSGDGDGGGKKLPTRTSRPPLELME